MSNTKIVFPEIKDMVAQRPISSSWLRGDATLVVLMHRTDCRPNSKRINVMIWDDYKVEIHVVEGDGRTPYFKQYAKTSLKNGSSLEAIAKKVTDLAETHFQITVDNQPLNNERIAANILTRIGFIEDDFDLTTAWVKPAPTDNFTIYIRGAAIQKVSRAKNVVVEIKMPDILVPDGECEVGLVFDHYCGRSFATADNLDEAIRIAEENLLPLPAIDEIVEYSPRDLFGGLRR
jgi:hypothetical protein